MVYFSSATVVYFCSALDTLPQDTDKAPNLQGWAHLDKVLGYRPVDDAGRITVPLLVIDAENEELFDRHQAGELAVERTKANGASAEYRVVPGITHYGSTGRHSRYQTRWGWSGSMTA